MEVIEISARVAARPTEKEVVQLLRMPDADLVDFMVALANLDRREAVAIDLCGRKAYTQEEAAEHIDRSPDAVQKWYRSGIKKLRSAWSGKWWVERLL
jgi:DNA-directed RNA polymerase specialized sigma24 family protein